MHETRYFLSLVTIETHGQGSKCLEQDEPWSRVIDSLSRTLRAKNFLSHPETHLTYFIFPSLALASFRFEGCCWQKGGGLGRTRVVQRDSSVQHLREDQKKRNGEISFATGTSFYFLKRVKMLIFTVSTHGLSA